MSAVSFGSAKKGADMVGLVCSPFPVDSPVPERFILSYTSYILRILDNSLGKLILIPLKHRKLESLWWLLIVDWV